MRESGFEGRCGEDGLGVLTGPDYLTSLLSELRNIWTYEYRTVMGSEVEMKEEVTHRERGGRSNRRSDSLFS